MRQRRVVITGIGVVAPNGIGKEAYWNALLEGRSGISKVTLFDVSKLPTQIAGEIKEFDPLDFMTPKQAKYFSRQTRFGLAAAKLAVQDANLEPTRNTIEKRSVILGTTFPNIDVLESALRRNLYEFDLSKESLLAFTKGNPFSNASEISSELNFTDSSRVFMNSCSGGLISIGMAFQEIRQNENAIFLAGGTDGLMSPVPFICMCASGMMSKNNENPHKACRPFDLKRDGGVMAEGAGIVVMESLSNAKRRGASIYAEIIGFGDTAIGVNSENPKEGLKTAMQKALRDAMIDPKDVDYISAHAPSDPTTDKAEVAAIKEVFMQHAYRIPITSIKSTIGSPFAAAGPLQLISTSFSLNRGIIPPTFNYEHPDPLCDLDFVPNSPRRNDIQVALINSHGLGGTDSCVIIKKYI